MSGLLESRVLHKEAPDTQGLQKYHIFKYALYCRKIKGYYYNIYTQHLALKSVMKCMVARCVTIKMIRNGSNNL